MKSLGMELSKIPRQRNGLLQKPVPVPFETRSEVVKFVEAKVPDMQLVAEFLKECAAVNQWANFGPLYHRLADEYSAYMNIPDGSRLVPCANAGVGLELMARECAVVSGKESLRWVGSSFSFKNLGRGYFSDMQFVDCDAQGVLDFTELEALPADSFDGVIVTNPFGLYRNFDRFIEFAERAGKPLLIDNAAGVDREIPNWPWQVFSLHHTKPHGVGEGGLMLVPADIVEALTLLMNYDLVPDNAAHWLNNCKISDIACAFQLARLQQYESWKSGYIEQRERVQNAFASVGLQSLLPTHGSPLTMSIPIRLPFAATLNDLTGGSVDITKQYEPLSNHPMAQDIFSRSINFPVHPDIASVSDARLAETIERFLVLGDKE